LATVPGFRSDQTAAAAFGLAASDGRQRAPCREPHAVARVPGREAFDEVVGFRAAKARGDANEGLA
jgi:hypothetical protein